MKPTFHNLPKVCVFDSGIGGLTLLYECVRKVPFAEYYYFADNNNVPYGNLSQDCLKEKTDAIFQQISLLNPTAAVIACNTVTAQCAEYLRAKYSFPIIGIQPAVKPAAAVGSCAVMATPATVESQSMKQLIERYGKGRTEVVACPNLAAFIENNIFNPNIAEFKILLPAIQAKSIVLGCTHYSFFKNFIQQYYSRPVFDGNLGTAEHLYTLLGNFDHEHDNSVKIEFLGGDTAKNKAVFNNIESIFKLC